MVSGRRSCSSFHYPQAIFTCEDRRLTNPQDNSDAQYRSFRSNLLALLALASTYLLTSAVQSRASPSPHHRAIFITIFAALMLIILHGISALKIFAILYGNFVLARWPKPPAVAKVWPALVIGGNMMLLFLNERYDGYKLGQLHAIFDSLVSGRFDLSSAERSPMPNSCHSRTRWEGSYRDGTSALTSRCCG